ncbi:MAG: PEGA domain-containing protein [Polyangiaceae bacterium]|jgi:tetratricopeptide (TPR) repeat protein
MFTPGLLLVMAACPLRAGAQDADDPTHEAGKHFQRAVALYSETDYRAALVEFKRAYAIAPNVAVLYNVGETQYQVQDYAGALATFTRYLAESTANEPRRAEVESTLQVLRTRVGHLSVVTDPVGADLSIDDQPVGKTPLDDRLVVSVGHRKVTASLTGRSVVTRFVDVAADDNVSLNLALPAAAEPPADVFELPPPPRSEAATSSRGGGAALRIAGWIGTGVLAAGAGSMGFLALKEARALSQSRDSYPTTGATLRQESKLTLTYSVLADSLTGAAVVLGGVTLYSTLSSRISSHASETSLRAWLGPTSANVELKF